MTYKKLNESFYEIQGTPEQLQEIKRKFTIKTNNGIIVPSGLIQFLSKFNIIPSYNREFTTKQVLDHLKTLNIPFELYDYQEKMIVESIVNQQQLCLACTASGKSVSIFGISNFLYNKGKKGLILVPNISLTTQLFGDFKDYNATEEFLSNIRLIGGDNNVKELDKLLTISTIDECQGLKLDNVSTDIVYNSTNAKYRIGLTGTLPDDPIAKMAVMSCVGAPKRYIRTQGLIERGLATPVHINVLKLRYNNEDKALFKYVGNYTKK